MQEKKEAKKRVKCANCGMIYDIYVDVPRGWSEHHSCPKCGSNAYDLIMPSSISIYT